jgi:hypothetical protein
MYSYVLSTPSRIKKNSFSYPWDLDSSWFVCPWRICHADCWRTPSRSSLDRRLTAPSLKEKKPVSIFQRMIFLRSNTGNAIKWTPILCQCFFINFLTSNWSFYEVIVAIRVKFGIWPSNRKNVPLPKTFPWHLKILNICPVLPYRTTIFVPIGFSGPLFI